MSSLAILSSLPSRAFEMPQRPVDPQYWRGVTNQQRAD